MAAATPSGGEGGCSSGGGVGGYGDLPGLGSDEHVRLDGGGSSSNYSSDDEDLEEAPLSMEQRVRLAEIWVANPTTSHHWTCAAGGVM
jgi:hypothetical protein